MITFALRSPSRDVFIQSWQNAGILDAGEALTPAYANDVQIDEIGTIEKNGTPIAGWHCNVRVFGATEQAMTAGLPQVAEDGSPIPLFERTRAALVFGLTQRDADPVTGFPAGMRDVANISYCDLSDINTPSRVWA